MLIDFCLPIYNEEKILEKSILTLLNYLKNQNYNFLWQIIIVINGSSDKSRLISKSLSEKYPLIKYVEYAQAGRGNALKEYWLQSRADIVLYMDIDLAVSLDDITKLLTPIINNKADLAIGSRLMPESKIKRSFIRELSSQSYNFLSRIILSHHFSDMQCGFKAIKTEAFEIISPNIKSHKWFFDTELISFAKKFGYNIIEVPVDWSENRYDKRKSKVNLFFDSLKFLVNLIKLKFRLIKTRI